jgi:hypothetical protein
LSKDEYLTHWVIENKSGSKNIDHYLDDFLFGGEKGTNECKNLMLQFEQICSEIGVQCKNVENLSKVAHDTEHPIGIHLSM